MTDEFNYHQRPWSKRLTDEEYDRATGRLAASFPPCDHCNATNAPVNTCTHGAVTIRNPLALCDDALGEN